MKIIRRNTFETNSSSTHSLTICTKEEFENFKNGEMMLYANESLIPKTKCYSELHNLKKNYIEEHPEFDENNEEDIDDFEDYVRSEGEYETYNQWEDDEYLETFIENYKTPNGEEIVVFGKYGYDG